MLEMAIVGLMEQNHNRHALTLTQLTCPNMLLGIAFA